MKVESGASFLFSAPRNLAVTITDAQDFAAMLSPRTADGHETTEGDVESDAPDFTSMTRQDLFDWMNGKVRDGDMSLDESSTFMGMTVKISALTGEPVDLAADKSRIDFTEKAREGIEFFQSRFGYASADALQDALDTMLAGR